jgi:hypothetical protein
VLVYRPGNPHAYGNGMALEHRVVAAEARGRPLESNERVHHIDGNRSNNDPANLEVWLSDHPAGRRVSDVASRAIEDALSYLGSRLDGIFSRLYVLVRLQRKIDQRPPRRGLLRRFRHRHTEPQKLEG